MAKPAEREPTLLRSVARAVKVLLYVAENDQGRTAKEAAAGLGMPIATTYHVLNTLASEGLLAKDSRRRYRLGPKMGVLADAFAHQLTPPEYLLAPLRRLADSTGESAHLTGWRNEDVVILASIEGRQAVRVSAIHVGTSGNAHARAAGKAVLAHIRPEQAEAYIRRHPLPRLTPNTITDEAALRAELERVRKRGYAIDWEELIEGVCCVAAPITDSGTVIGAYSVSAPSGRFRQNQKELTRAVLEAAADVGGRDGPGEPPDPVQRAGSVA